MRLLAFWAKIAGVVLRLACCNIVGALGCDYSTALALAEDKARVPSRPTFEVGCDGLKAYFAFKEIDYSFGGDSPSQRDEVYLHCFCGFLIHYDASTNGGILPLETKIV